MGRKAQPAAPLVADAPLDAEALVATQNIMGAVTTEMQEERDLVNQLLGQAQMAESFAKFSLTVSTSKLAFVKENKLYRALAGKKTADGQQFSGTWDEFCGLLGRSRQQIDEDIANLRALGEEALESMSRMGIGYRELRQWRRLPDDARSALIEAAKQGNRDAVEYLAEELIATHAKEKEALTKRLDEVNADYEAQGELMATKTAELDRVRIELEKAKRRIETLTVEEAAKQLREEASSFAFEVEAAVCGKLAPAMHALHQHSLETGQDHRAVMTGLITQVERAIAEIRAEYGIQGEPDADPTPAWMREGADAVVASALAEGV